MREWIWSAAFIARTDLSFILRQRETLLWVFAMPLLFFYFIGTVTGGFGGGDPNRPDPLALRTDAPRGVVLDAIVERLKAGHFRVDRPTTAEAFSDYSRRLVMPAFTDDSVRAGTQVQATLELRGDNVAVGFDQVRVARALYSVVGDLAVLSPPASPRRRRRSRRLPRHRARSRCRSLRPADGKILLKASRRPCQGRW